MVWGVIVCGSAAAECEQCYENNNSAVVDSITLFLDLRYSRTQARRGRPHCFSPMSPRFRRIAALVVGLVLLIMVLRGVFRALESTHGGVRQPSGVVQSAGSYVAEANLGSPDIHCVLGVPTAPSGQDSYLLKRAQYVTSFNTQTNNPNWVSYNLSRWWYGDAPRHRGEFLPDPDLPKDYFHVLHRDYTRSGYDRGHMCRSEERTRNDADNLTTFYTTNLVPQTHELNAGPWLALEDYCEALCKRDDKELYVVDGPIYEQDLGSIGRGVKVPSSCFKIVVILEKGQGLADCKANTPIIAVIMPNNRDCAANSWRDYVCSVHDVERRSGLLFLTALSADLQRALKELRSTPDR